MTVESYFMYICIVQEKSRGKEKQGDGRRKGLGRRRGSKKAEGEVKTSKMRV